MKFRKMSFILCMLMLLFSGITAYAAECDLGIILGEKGAEVELAVYKVADIKDGEHIWLPEYEGVEIDFSRSRSASETKEIAEKIYRWIEENDISATFSGITDEDGSLSFKVKAGAYLLAKVSEKGTMAPVLFILPEGESEESLLLSPKFAISDELDDTDEPDDTDDKDDTDEKDDTNDKDGDSGKKDQTTSAQTGDTANIVLWVSVLIAALAGIMVVFKKNHSKR